MTNNLSSLIDLSLGMVDNLVLVWTFLLLVTRFTAFFLVVPGIGAGIGGLAVRTPAILILSFASLHSKSFATLPSHAGELVTALFSELLLGLALGIIPLLIISGLQMAVQLSTTSMGLGAAQLMDPTIGASVPELAKLLSDIAIILFFFVGGHHVVLYAVAGAGGEIIPGTFFVSENSLGLLIERSGYIFRLGMTLSAPVVIALLLTQFMMGLVTKAVPTVNVFVVSAPITLGIGLVLTILSLPGIVTLITKQYTGIESAAVIIAKDAQHRAVDKDSKQSTN